MWCLCCRSVAQLVPPFELNALTATGQPFLPATLPRRRHPARGLPEPGAGQAAGLRGGRRRRRVSGPEAGGWGVKRSGRGVLGAGPRRQAAVPSSCAGNLCSLPLAPASHLCLVHPPSSHLCAPSGMFAAAGRRKRAGLPDRPAPAAGPDGLCLRWATHGGRKPARTHEAEHPPRLAAWLLLRCSARSASVRRPRLTPPLRPTTPHHAPCPAGSIALHALYSPSITGTSLVAGAGIMGLTFLVPYQVGSRSSLPFTAWQTGCSSGARCS